MKIERMLPTFIILFLVSFQAIANDEEIIEGKAPKGIEVLSTVIDSHEGMLENRGRHGLREFCYEADSYVVYSTNLLGNGYQLSKGAPKSLECSKINKPIESKNKLGMHIGMSKKSVEDLIGLGSLKEEKTIIWQSVIFIDGRRFDLQTHVALLFKEGRLAWLSVFTTTTS